MKGTAWLLFSLLSVLLKPCTPACPGYLHASNPEKGQCTLALQNYDSGKWKRRDEHCVLRQDEDLQNYAYPFHWMCHRRGDKDNSDCTEDAQVSKCQQRAIEIANWYWEPDSCSLRSFNATVFDKVLAGKKLVIVGDSLGLQQYQSMRQLLGPVTTGFAEADAGFIAPSRAGRTMKLKSGGQVIFRHHIHLVGTDKQQELDAGPDTTFEANGWSIHSMTADFVMFNTGHHWHTVDPTFERYEKMVRSVLEHIATQRRGPYFMFRTSNLGHVMSEKFSEPLQGPQNLTWGHQYYEQWRQVRDHEHVWPSLIEEYGLAHRVKVLNISFTDARADGHSNQRLSPTKLGADGAPLQYNDWLHYCLPGVPDYWNWLVYDAVVGIVSKQAELAAI